jgi:hypothetical protein
VKKFRFSLVVAVCASLLSSVVVIPGAVAHAALPTGASAYAPITPARLADTRAESGSYGYSRVDSSTIRVQVTGRFGIPAGATAAVLNIASVNSVAPGYVTAYPAGAQRPLASSLNVDYPGRIIANMATVRLSADGAVDLFTLHPMDLVVDVAGAYVPVAGAVSAGRLITISGGARRALDTRDAGLPLGPGGTQIVDLQGVGVPADAIAVVVNIAAVDALPGYWTAYPNGNERPLASSLNIDEIGQTRNSQGIVRLNPNTQAFNVFSQNGGHLVVDVVGWFTGGSAAPSTEGLFVPTSPTRRLDTRSTFTNMSPWGGTTIEFESGAAAPSEVGAVAMNIAIAEPLYVGFITAFPAGQPRPLAANLNITSFDQIISNHAIVRTGTRGIALFTQNGAQMIVDVTGWYLGAPDASPQPVAPVPTYGITKAVAVSSATAGFSVPIGTGLNITAIVDRGVAGLWAGYGYVGTPDHNVYFAHRTTHGAPFLHIDRMPVGSTFTLTGADGTRFLYMVIRIDVILPTPSILLDIAVHSGPVTATVVACHPPHSTKYRLAVTGRLIGVVTT